MNELQYKSQTYKSKGVTYTYHIDCGFAYVTDIDVQSGIETFAFCSVDDCVTIYALKALDKCFQEIKVIDIEYGVRKINISNSLFPNADTLITHSKNDMLWFSQKIHNIKTLTLDFDSAPEKLSDFAKNTNIENIVNDNIVYKSVDGVIYSKDGRILFSFPSARTGHYDILPGTEIIAQRAFMDSMIESVTCPDSLRYIMNEVFSHSCLKTVELNEGLLTIGDEAFSRSSVTDITLPDSLAHVGNYAFNTPSLKSIRLNSQAVNIIHSFNFSDDNQNLFVVSLYYNDKLLLFPSSDWGFDDVIRNYLEMLLFSGDITQMCIIKYISNTYLKQKIAIMSYQIEPDKDIGAYLRRVARNIMSKLIEKDDESTIQAFLSFDIMTTVQLKAILKMAENCSATIKAYIMQAIGSSEKDKTSFRL